MMENGYSGDYELESYKKEYEQVQIRSNLEFLNQHNGHRSGKLHLYIGGSGTGKTTLIRTLIIDILEWKRSGHTPDNVGLWLSEETIKDFKIEFSKSGYKKPVLKDLLIHSEMNTPGLTKGDLINFISSGIKYFIFDNITTSKLYGDMKPHEQSNFVHDIKSVANEHNVAVILVAHTGAEITDTYANLITPNNIRGGKGIINLCEYIYVMQRFIEDSMIFPTLRIEKSRGYQIRKKFFYLDYSSPRFIYKQTKPIDFEEFKDAFKRRNKL